MVDPRQFEVAFKIYTANRGRLPETQTQEDISNALGGYTNVPSLISECNSVITDAWDLMLSVQLKKMNQDVAEAELVKRHPCLSNWSLGMAVVYGQNMVARV